MSPSQVIQTIQQLLPRIKSSSAGAENILLEYASENNLEPAVLVKMAQTMNTARTLAFLEKNADNRGGTFPLLDPVAIGDKYIASKSANAPKKQASYFDIELGEDNKLPNFFKMAAQEVEPVTVKSASVETPTAKSARDLNREYRASQDKQFHLEREIEKSMDLREDLADQFKSAFNKLANFLRNNSDSAIHIGEDVSALGEIEDVAIYQEAVKEANTYINCKVASFDSSNPTHITKRKLINDRFNVMPLVKAATSKLKLIEDIDFYVSKKETEIAAERFHYAEKTASAVANEVDYDKKKESKRHQSEKGLVSRTIEGAMSGASKALFGDDKKNKNKDVQDKNRYVASVSVLPENLTDAAKKLLGRSYSKEERAQKIDANYEDAVAVGNLQKLMLTDPILSEADPYELVDMFNDLRVANPEAAKSTNMLRFALREALQYGGIPQQSAKTLTEIDRTAVQARELRREALKDLYLTS